MIDTKIIKKIDVSVKIDRKILLRFVKDYAKQNGFKNTVKLSGISSQTLSRLNKGERIGTDTLLKICKKLV